MDVWTLKYGATERSLDDWGIEQPKLTFASRAVDQLAFSVVADFDGAAQFEYGATVELYCNTPSRRRVFAGRITAIPRAAGGSEERLSYEAQGAHWYLANKVYQEFWSSVGEYKSRVQLTYGEDGDKMSSEDTLRQILQYAIDAGAPFAIGNVAAIVGTIPSEDVGDRTCAEVIELILRWYPDAVTYWDYSTPLPTFNIATATTSPIVEFAEDGETLEVISYARRDDLRLPGVAIKYEWIDSVDGESIEVVTADSAGNPSAFGALVVTVSLRGGSVSTQRQKLVSEHIDLDSKSWWKRNVPELKGIPDANLTIMSIVRDDRTDADDNPIALPRKITEGSHADWMSGNTGRLQIIGRLRWRIGNVEKQGDFSVTGSGTTLSSNTYSSVSSSEEREPLPTGIAARMYAALNREHYEGTLELIEEECSRFDLLGKAVRLLSRSGSQLIAASQVQSVALDIQTGGTSITFGPNPSLSAGDLVDLLRCNRSRRDSSPGMKMRSGGGSTLTGPKTTANDSASFVADNVHSIIKGTGENPPKVTIDLQTTPNLPASQSSGMTVSLQRVRVGCINNGQYPYRWVMCSPIFWE